MEVMQVTSGPRWSSIGYESSMFFFFSHLPAGCRESNRGPPGCSRNGRALRWKGPEFLSHHLEESLSDELIDEQRPPSTSRERKIKLCDVKPLRFLGQFLTLMTLITL